MIITILTFSTGITETTSYSDLCSEIQRIIDEATNAFKDAPDAFRLQMNTAVRHRIEAGLKPLLNHDLAAYFLVVYDPVFGAVQHWGTVGHCIGSNYFRKNGFNVRFYYREFSDCSGGELGSITINTDDVNGAIASHGVNVEHNKVECSGPTCGGSYGVGACSGSECKDKYIVTD